MPISTSSCSTSFIEPGGSSSMRQMSMISGIPLEVRLGWSDFLFSVAVRAYATSRDLDARFLPRSGRSGVAGPGAGDRAGGAFRSRARAAGGVPVRPRALDRELLLGARVRARDLGAGGGLPSRLHHAPH